MSPRSAFGYASIAFVQGGGVDKPGRDDDRRAGPAAADVGSDVSFVQGHAQPDPSMGIPALLVVLPERDPELVDEVRRNALHRHDRGDQDDVAVSSVLVLDLLGRDPSSSDSAPEKLRQRLSHRALDGLTAAAVPDDVHCHDGAVNRFPRRPAEVSGLLWSGVADRRPARLVVRPGWREHAILAGSPEFGHPSGKQNVRRVQLRCPGKNPETPAGQRPAVEDLVDRLPVHQGTPDVNRQVQLVHSHVQE